MGDALCSMEGWVAGVDEAGRGPLAGPVLAAAIIVDPHEIEGEVFDSKRVSPKRREELYELLLSKAVSWATGAAEVEEIDRLNILKASLLAMRRAIEGLSYRPSLILVDGPHKIPLMGVEQRSVIHGDGLCPLIAAASIVAKVTRDRIMVQYDRLYPHYGFAKNKGYATPYHREAIRRYGPSPIHRRSFRWI
ncbi:MAG: ribonuclease HII [Deltaproteobacteria bacterium]|nr:MAG: ribonuclease HII [Deltaproteobacteria bacterium]